MNVKRAVLAGVIVAAVALIVFATYRPRVSLQPAFSGGFLEGPRGLEDLQDAYGFSFATDPLEPPPDDLIAAIGEERVDVADAHTLDPGIEKHDLIVLQDNKRFFLPNQAALLVRSGVLEKHDGLKDVLDDLAGRMSNELVRNLLLTAEGETDLQTVLGDLGALHRFIEERQGPATGNEERIAVVVPDDPGLRVASEAAALVIEAQTGLVVDRKEGGTSLKDGVSALVEGDADLRPVYIQAALDEVFNRDAVQGKRKAHGTAKDRFRKEKDLVLLDPLGFEAAPAVVMRRETSEAEAISTLSDLSNAQRKRLVAFVEEHGGDILSLTLEHLALTGIALAIALAVSLPVGIWLAKTRFEGAAFGVMSVAGMIQTIPSLALVALVALLFGLIMLPTVGKVPGVTALVLYALLPILRNTYTSIRQVDASVIEVARGMGMTSRQILFKVELPLSIPVIMAGVRIATVWTIGIATLVTLVGAGGLGDLIMRGLRSFHLDELAAGTLPAAVLALISDFALAGLEKLLTPSGLKEEGG